jgi:hypothetical protein
MRLYNKIMLYFWLLMASLIFLFITIMCFKEGFDRWAFYYVFAFIGFMMYFTKKWMMKRMDKHLAYMEQQREAQKKKE